MKRIAQKAWQAYRNLMEISLIGLALSASWAAVGTAILWLRLIPLATLLAFFLVCLAWSAWRVSIVRQIKISRQARVLEFSRQATLHIAPNGDLTISRTLSVANQGDRAVSGTIDEKMGFELDKLPSKDWAPDWKVVAVPVGKEISKIYAYSFDEEKPLIPDTVGRIRTLCWGVQIRPFRGTNTPPDTGCARWLIQPTQAIERMADAIAHCQNVRRLGFVSYRWRWPQSKLSGDLVCRS